MRVHHAHGGSRVYPMPRSTAAATGWVRTALLVFLALVAGLTSLGVLLTGDTLSGSTWSAGPVLLDHTFPVSEPIPTSFGQLRIVHTEQISGMSEADMGGMPMGNLPGMVMDDQVQIRAEILLSNQGDRPVPYTASQFRLVGTDGKAVSLAGGSVWASLLQPHTSVEANLGFTAPKDGARYWLEYRDPGHSRPIWVDLGPAGQTPGTPGEDALGREQSTHQH